jgi:hypothetical protein
MSLVHGAGAKRRPKRADWRLQRSLKPSLFPVEFPPAVENPVAQSQCAEGITITAWKSPGSLCGCRDWRSTETRIVSASTNCADQRFPHVR